MSDKINKSVSTDYASSRSLRELYFELGRSLSARQRYDEATAMFERALREDTAGPGNGEILIYLTQSQYQSGDQQSAFRSCLEVIASETEQSNAILSYAHDLLKRHTITAEREWIQREWKPKIARIDLRVADRAELAFFLGRVSLYLEEYHQALDYFQQAKQFLPHNVRVDEGIGEVLWRLGKLEQATKILSKARELAKMGEYPERLQVINAKLAQVFAASGQYDAALTLITETLIKDERFTYTLLLTRCECYLAVGEPEKALEAVEAAIALDSSQVQVHLLRVQALIASKRYKEAVDSVNQALQYDPSNNQVTFFKSQALIEGDIDLAQARRLLTHYLGQVKREEAMRQTLSPAFFARSEDGNAHYFLAQFYFTLENSRDALQEVNRALDLGFQSESNYLYAPAQQLKAQLLLPSNPIEASVWFHQAGRSFNERSEFQSAIGALEQARELNPAHAPIYWDLSNGLWMSSYIQDSPYVDAEKIKQSLDVWNEGIKKDLPDAESSWAYVLRAVINERLCLLAKDSDSAFKLKWEAVAYIERAILLYKEDAIRWSYLGAYYRDLNNEACALDATSKAFSYDAKNATVLGQRSAILANIGEYAEAEKAIDESLELLPEPDIWTKSVKAFIMLNSLKLEDANLDIDRFHKASTLVEDIVSESPKNIYNLGLLTTCYRIRYATSPTEENRSLLKANLEKIWLSYDPSDINNQSDFGWSAFNIGLLDQDGAMLDRAIEIYKQLPQNSMREQCSVYWNLGLCYLVKEDLAAGEKSLACSIELATSKGQLNDLLYLDLMDIERTTTKRADKNDIREITGRIKERISAQKTQISQERSVENELKRIISKLITQEETNGPEWMGAHASLARFYTENQRWGDAATEYQLLQKQAPQFSEVRIGLETVFDALLVEGDQLLKEGKFLPTQPLSNDDNQREKDGLERYIQALQLELLPGDKIRQAKLYSRLGYAYFDRGNLTSARQHFAKAMQFVREGNMPEPGTLVGDVCRSLLQDAASYWALDSEWETQVNEPGSSGLQQNDFAAARKSLSRYLYDLFQLSAKSINSGDMFPITDRIIIEIGQELIPGVSDVEQPIFKTYIPEMQKRIRDEIGIQVPVGMVGENSSIPSDGYTIQLEDGLVVKGTVQVGWGYCLATVDMLQKFGIPTLALNQVPHPLTGEPGCWVQRDYWQIISESGLQLWKDPWFFICYHLESVLRQNLTMLLSIQDVDDLIWDWRKQERGPALIQAALPDQPARLRLAKLLRALLKEGVPIVAWEEILVAFQHFHDSDDDFDNVLRAARLRLKKWLPGNTSGVERHKLPREYEDRIVQWISYEHGKICFASPPEETDKLLRAIHSLVEFTGPNRVLVIRHAKLRYFIRQLIAQVFPDLTVLSQEELLSENQLQADTTR